MSLSQPSSHYDGAMLNMQGQGVARGIAIGKAVVMGAAALDVAHYYVAPSETGRECQRLYDAIDLARAELQALVADLPTDTPRELGALLKVHSLLLDDPHLVEPVSYLIQTQRYNAEWALTTHGQVLLEQFATMADEYLRERGADIRQVIERVLRVLAGSPVLLPDPSVLDNEAPLIVVARDISPADMLRLRDRAFGAFLTDLGGPTSHTAIVARSMNVPAVVGLGDCRRLVRDGDTLIVDGDSGAVLVNPSAKVLHEFRQLQLTLEEERRVLAALRDSHAVTLDGERIHLEANIELPDEVAAALDAGAEGIGLFRTEFLFMGRRELPSEQEQYEAYAEVITAMKGLPVTIRTLDIGADKTLDDDAVVATNPALGLRAIRYCLAEPELFATQLRALLRASQHGQVRILLPMLTSLQELAAVRLAVKRAQEALRERGVQCEPNFELGAMVETPAVAIAVRPFAEALDFLSIGTNDLIQYTLAVDRTDPDVADMYDPMHPAVLSLIAHVLRVGEQLGKPVAMCGEMAGSAPITPLLLGLGLKNFSMHPQQLPEVKSQILQAHAGQLRETVLSSIGQGAMLSGNGLDAFL